MAMRIPEAKVIASLSLIASEDALFSNWLLKSSHRESPLGNTHLNKHGARRIHMNRRRFILTANSLLSAQSLMRLLPLTIVASAHSQTESFVAPQELVGEWMDAVIETRSLYGVLNLSRFVEPVYYLTKPISWEPNEAQRAQYSPVNVPMGFVTDLASIPRVFFSYLRPDGEYAHAAIIHDYLYWTQSRSRTEADSIFKLAMEDLEVSPSTVAVIYRAVDLFGASAWRNNAVLRRNGEKRIMREFPSDPKTRWRDWKMRADVFAS